MLTANVRRRDPEPLDYFLVMILMATLVVLIRSFNRPLYLRRTIRSIRESGIRRRLENVSFVVYDDGSEDPWTLLLLRQISKLMGFSVVTQINKGCALSYLDALRYLSVNWSKCDYYVVMDNDLVVSRHWLESMESAYVEAERCWPDKYILLSGFHPTNAHLHNKFDVRVLFHQRETIGAACFMFARRTLPEVMRGWSLLGPNGILEDWGVNYIFHTSDAHRLACLNKGVINHIGIVGCNSTPELHDVDRGFEQ